MQAYLNLNAFLLLYFIFSIDMFRETLMSIAKHYETGESLPEEIYLKLVAARTFRAGSLSLRQVSVFGLCYLLFPSMYFPFICLISFCSTDVKWIKMVGFHFSSHVCASIK